jgi:hypothetical protein
LLPSWKTAATISTVIRTVLSDSVAAAAHVRDRDADGTAVDHEFSLD